MDTLPRHRLWDEGRTMAASSKDTKAGLDVWNTDSLHSPGSSSVVSISSDSSLKSLPSDSTALSLTSLTASNLSLDDCYEDSEIGEDTIVFPSYDEIQYYGRVPDIAPSKTARSVEYRSGSNGSTPTIMSRSGSPAPPDHSEDDTAIHGVPTRHVDYLTHSWHEEDLWATWKHLKLKQKSYTNSARLENASWRLWGKTKSELKTVPPETINWLKEHDVTWLYGPLMKGESAFLRPVATSASPAAAEASPSNGLLNRKPTLRRRSLSEIFLRESRSSSSLLQEISDAVVQARQSNRKQSYDIQSASSSIRQPPRQLSNTLSDACADPSSELVAISSELKKTIRFSEEVEQFIAINPHHQDDWGSDSQYDSDSDDSGIMMKRSNPKRRLPAYVKAWRARKMNSSRNMKAKATFAKLPSTTLKHTSDGPDPLQTSMKHSFGIWHANSLLPGFEQSKTAASEFSNDDNNSKDLDWHVRDPKDLDELEHIPATSELSLLSREPSASKILAPAQGKVNSEEVSGLVSDTTVGASHLKGVVSSLAPAKNDTSPSATSLNNTYPVRIRSPKIMLPAIHTGSLGSENSVTSSNSYTRAVVNNGYHLLTSSKTHPITELGKVTDEKRTIFDNSHTERKRSAGFVSRRRSIIAGNSFDSAVFEQGKLTDDEDDDSDSSGSERAWLRAIDDSTRGKRKVSKPIELKSTPDLPFQDSARSSETIMAIDDDQSATQYSSSESGIGSNNSVYMDLCTDTERNLVSPTQSVDRVLDPMRQALVDRIMEEFWGLFGEGWYTEGVKECAGSSSSSTSVSNTDSSNTTDRTSLPPVQRKRLREEDDLPDDRNGKTPRQPSSSIRSRNIPNDDIKLACPFRKHDPGRYGIYNHRVCALSHWKTISRIKEHLYRCHKMAVHCKRCWKLFKTQDQLDSHLTVADVEICKLRAGEAPEGITPEHERRLKSRKKTSHDQSDEKRWMDIYRLLFPNEEIPSPYFEPLQEEVPMSPDSQDLADYEAYIRRELPRLVRSNIEEVVRRDMQPLEASLLGNLASIIESCQDKVFKSYREARGGTSWAETPLAISHEAFERLESIDTTDDEVNKTPRESHPQPSEFLNNVFQYPPVQDSESDLPVPYESKAQRNFAAPFGDVIVSDSGYASEQLTFCACVGPCRCAGTPRLPDIANPDPSDGFLPADENMAFNDWNSYPRKDQMELMGEDFHWMNNI